MRSRNRTLQSRCLAGICLMCLVSFSGKGYGKQFTVADDIRLTTIDPVLVSPNSRYFIVISARGRLDLDHPESCLRVYQVKTVRRMLRLRRDGVPNPVWKVCRAVYHEGPNIHDVRWLRDSTGFVFLAKTKTGSDQLFLAQLSGQQLQSLTPVNQHITGFDVRKRDHFVYTALSPRIRKAYLEERSSIATVGTGRALDSLIFPQVNGPPDVWDCDLSELWIVNGKSRFRVITPFTKRPISIHLEGQRALALSPDGLKVATALTVKDVPAEWVLLYPSPSSSSPYRIKAKKQDPNGFHGQRDISEYVSIDVKTGKVEELTQAPIGNSLGWWGLSHAEWSKDGKLLLLSDTFIEPRAHSGLKSMDAPCVAIYDHLKHESTCLVSWGGASAFADANNAHQIYGAHFDLSHPKTIDVEYCNFQGATALASFTKTVDDSWKLDPTRTQPNSNHSIVEITVDQDLNRPPALIATDKRTGTSRVIWEPNVQLKNTALGEVSVFKWRDSNGREWIGGLYKPPDYVKGRTYPLVIQTHGFNEQRFAPSGAFSTAFAAQELAATGFVVLQVRDCPIRATPEEAPCQLDGYKTAVRRLATDGLVDPEHVGIIGFSRTCYYVLAALTSESSLFEAASVTDGVDEGYLQYMLDLDLDSDNSIAQEAESIIGDQPFGHGLKDWLLRSPTFNMDRVNTPLQVVATPQGLLQMWEPYAALRYLGKPVDLILLNSNEHVLTNPSARMVSQGGTVDWFRFWLQNYVDPNPKKSCQYARWELLRKQAVELKPSDKVVPSQISTCRHKNPEGE